jgi:hypothetical protein
MACVICFEKFSRSGPTEPFVFNCGHSFCRKCKTGIKVCPSCRTFITSKAKNYGLIEMLKEGPPKTVDDSPSVKNVIIPKKELLLKELETLRTMKEKTGNPFREREIEAEIYSIGLQLFRCQ